jgi:hypothetical protein
MSLRDYQSRLYIRHNFCLMDDFCDIIAIKGSTGSVFLALDKTNNICNILRIVYNTEDLDTYQSHTSINALLKARK